MKHQAWPVLLLALAATTALATNQAGRIRSKRARQTVSAARQNTYAFAPTVRYVWNPDAAALFPGGSSSTIAPADPTVAVGPACVLQAVNSEVRIFDKSGLMDFQQTAADFFAPVAQSTSLTSPKAYYDTTMARYVLLFLDTDVPSQVCNVVLAVSDDSDPHGTWFLYRIDAKTTSSATLAWMDYAGLGANDDGIAITGNRHAFSDGSPGGTAFIYFDKTPLQSGAPISVIAQVDTDRQNVQMGFNGDHGSPFIFGAAWTSETSLRLYGLRDPAGPLPTIFFVDRSVGTTPTAPATALSTNGRLIDTNGTAAMSASAFGSRMSVAYNTLANGRAAVRFFSFDTSNFSTASVPIVDVATVSSPSLDYFQPSIRYNSNGDLALMFTACSTSVTADVMVCGKTINEPVAFFSAPVVAASAVGSAYSQFDWGENFSIGVDGADGEGFWGTAMTVGADDLWTTAIENWYVSRTWPESPTDATWIRGTVQSGTTASLASEDGDYFVARAGLVLFAGEAPAQLSVVSVAPTGQVLSLELDVVAKANTPGLSQRTSLWNWTTNSWVTVGQSPVGTGNTLQSSSATGTLADYVDPATHGIRARIVWFQNGLVLLWPWLVSVDRVGWRIRTRQ